jgi:hypothetical protein
MVHIFDYFSHRYFHPQKRYKLVSLSYLMCVPFSSSYKDGLVTSELCRRPMA